MAADIRICSIYNITKVLSEFIKDKKNKDGICKYCKSCNNLIISKYASTFNGYLTKLLSGARNHSKMRKNKGRDEAGYFNISIEDIKNLWEQQNGLCYYSKIKMNTLQCSNWQCSIERFDTTKGYIVENICLCCLEFNHSKQWSIDKINSIVELSTKEYILPNFNYEESNRKGIKGKPIEIKKINDLTYKKCNKCNIFQLENQYCGRTNYCKSCKHEYDLIWIQTPRAHFLNLLSRAKHRIIKINKKRNLEFTITYNDIVNIYKSQNGRCAYSNIPMTFGRNIDKEWLCSLERIDPLIGYTIDNICLICYEFNTADRTSLSKNENIKGSCAWNKEKFQYFMNIYLAS